MTKESSPDELSPAASDNVRRQSLRRGGGRTFFFVALLLGLCALLAWWVLDRWSHVYIDDARIAANVVTVSSEVSGRVIELPVVAGDHVVKGQLLATIDSADTLQEILSLEAKFAALEAEQRQLQAEQAMLRTQIASKVAAGNAQIASAAAAHNASKATLERARRGFERISQLAGHEAMSQQELEDAQAALEVARQQERLTASDVEKEKAGLAVVRAEEAQVGVLERRLEIIAAQKAALEPQREQKQLDLKRREIRAEFDGVVDAVFVDAGEYLTPASRVLLYHDPARIWIDANVKETHFSRLRLGATANVKVDAYPGITLSARVERLGGAATSLFALLPSPNPSGNFTKVTQRLPIRLEIEQNENLLRPGMMVELIIDVD